MSNQSNQSLEAIIAFSAAATALKYRDGTVATESSCKEKEKKKRVTGYLLFAMPSQQYTRRVLVGFINSPVGEKMRLCTQEVLRSRTVWKFSCCLTQSESVESDQVASFKILAVTHQIFLPWCKAARVQDWHLEHLL